MQADHSSITAYDSRRLDGSKHDTTDESSVQGAIVAENLVERCHKLLNELEAFQKHLQECKQEQTVELKPFRSSIAAELKSLERVSDLYISQSLSSISSTDPPAWERL